MTREHEYYVELCALATSGTLNDHEWAELRAHLKECTDCKEALQKFRDLAKSGMAMLMNEGRADDATPQKSWSPEIAKRELFARILRGDLAARVALQSGARRNAASWFGPRLAFGGGFAAASALFAVLGTASWIGTGAPKKAVASAAPVAVLPVAPAVGSEPWQSQLQAALSERDSLARRIGTLDSQLADLSRMVSRQQEEAAHWQEWKTRSDESFERKGSEVKDLKMQIETLHAQRLALGAKLQTAEESLSAAQTRFEALREEHKPAQPASDRVLLAARVEELAGRLKESSETIQQQRQFLASDRDIRELMGARDLSISDVFDVDRNGNTQRAFGRVFYTKGRSLVFYAFDLDRQQRVRTTNVFQAWGRRGLADQRPLNMGIFFLDNEVDKRWVLKFDDPDLLTQIDAVFVTVEPNGGSKRPSGKQLLFASFRAPVNHP